MAYSSITKPTDYFNTITWVGSGNSSRDFTGVGFAPDLVWVKNRGGSVAINHSLYDRLRGAGANKELVPNNNSAEGAENHDSYDYLSAFGSDGFSSTYVGNVAYYFNESGANYVGWSWLANGGTGSSNSDGSITSTVSANTTAGFSIVSYTGSGSSGATVGHGLGVKPDIIITKSRVTADNWGVYQTDLGATKGLYLNTTNAGFTASGLWNNTEPTSSIVTLGDNAATNDSGNMIAYCFAEKQGYSKFGSYTGNGNADGPFVYTGFRPAWIMVKRTDSANNWTIQDSTRDPENPVFLYLSADDSDAEAGVIAEGQLDFLSNGFKLRQTYGSHNASGGTYIYMVFAENPFVGNDSGTAVPVTAR